MCRSVSSSTADASGMAANMPYACYCYYYYYYYYYNNYYNYYYYYYYYNNNDDNNNEIGVGTADASGMAVNIPYACEAGRTCR
jgi:hypothetical protein